MSIIDKLDEFTSRQGIISAEWCVLLYEVQKLQEQNKELVELLKEADSVIDDYLNWRNEKRMDYFDARATKLFKSKTEHICLWGF